MINLILFFLFYFINFIINEKISGEMINSNSWALLTRFCFDNNDLDNTGIKYLFFNWNSYYVDVGKPGNHSIHLFSTDIELDDIFNSPNSCFGNYAKADISFSVENNSTDFYQVIPFDYISCYYVTLSNCDYRCYGSLCQSDLNIKYTFNILNGDRNNLGHLSVDEKGLVSISAVFLYIYLYYNK